MIRRTSIKKTLGFIKSDIASNLIKDQEYWQQEIAKQTGILSSSGMDIDSQSLWAWFVSSYNLNKADRAILSNLLGIQNEVLKA